MPGFVIVADVWEERGNRIPSSKVTVRDDDTNEALEGVLYGPISVINHHCGASFDYTKTTSQPAVKGHNNFGPRKINLELQVRRVSINDSYPEHTFINHEASGNVKVKQGSEVYVYYGHPASLWFKCQCSFCKQSNYRYESERLRGMSRIDM